MQTKAHTHTHYIHDNDQSIGSLTFLCNRVYRISLFVRKRKHSIKRKEDTGV